MARLDPAMNDSIARSPHADSGLFGSLPGGRGGMFGPDGAAVGQIDGKGKGNLGNRAGTDVNLWFFPSALCIFCGTIISSQYN